MRIRTIHQLALKKALGEGSRGGRVIGHTRSGKAVYARSHMIANEGWSAKDHFDAAALHRQSASEVRDYEPDEAANHDTAADHHKFAHDWKTGKVQPKLGGSSPPTTRSGVSPYDRLRDQKVRKSSVIVQAIPNYGAGPTETPSLPDFQYIYHPPASKARDKREQEAARNRADASKPPLAFHGNPPGDVQLRFNPDSTVAAGVAAEKLVFREPSVRAPTFVINNPPARPSRRKRKKGKLVER